VVRSGAGLGTSRRIERTEYSDEVVYFLGRPSPPPFLQDIMASMCGWRFRHYERSVLGMLSNQQLVRSDYKW